jgi:SAM-dependent methyltransferase
MNDARTALEQLAGGTPREVEPHIFELSPPIGPAHYDRIARIYDAALGTRAYNRILWKTTPARHRAFATSVFDSQTAGPHIELGCGSLLFTAHLYEHDRGRPVILVDQSIQMLRLARARIAGRSGKVPPHVVLARGDVRALDVTGNLATSVLAVFVLHVLDEPDALLRALDHVARPSASTIGLTSLHLAGGRGDVFLKLLHAAGELSVPRSRSTLDQLIAARIPGRAQVETDGSMAYITVTR